MTPREVMAQAIRHSKSLLSDDLADSCIDALHEAGYAIIENRMAGVVTTIIDGGNFPDGLKL